MSFERVLYVVRLTLMKPVFLSILFFLMLARMSSAQDLRIVKDNVNCSYGLKDKNGKWFIQPSFTLIVEYSSGYFLMKDALGDGLMSPTGKWVIPCNYDRLIPARPVWQLVNDYSQTRSIHPPKTGFFFYADRGHQKFLLNSRGKEIIELNPIDHVQFDGEAHILIYAGGSLTSTYLDTTGKILIDKLPGAILPFGSSEFSLHGKGIESYSKVVMGNVRLINRKGEFPLNEQFDRAIFGAKNQICFENDGKYGEMSTNGKLLIEPKYSRKESLSSSAYVNQNWVIYSETGHQGLMKPDGTVILEPKYDEIRFPNWNKDKDRLWIATMDARTGVFDVEGKAVVPGIYDAVTLVYDHTDEQNHRPNFIVEKDGIVGYIRPSVSSVPSHWYDEIKLVGDQYRGSWSYTKLIVRQNQKFGVLNLDGSVFLECTYDGYGPRTGSDDWYFFWNELDVSEYYFGNGSIQPKSWKVAFKNEQDVWFTDSKSFISGKLSESNGQLISLNSSHQGWDVYGNLMLLSRSDHGDWEMIHVKTHEKIVLKKVKEITRFSNSRFLLRTTENRYGLLDEDGKPLIEPQFLELKPNYQSPYAWALVEKNAQREEKWILVDDNGMMVFSDTLATAFNVNSGDQLLTIEGKTGLFDTKALTWKIQPSYPCLFKSIGDSYIASFAQDKKGILRADGTEILPLMYSSISVLTSNFNPNQKLKQSEELKIRWLARTETSEIIVDQGGNKLISGLDIREYKMALLFNNAEFEDPFSGLEPCVFSLEIGNNEASSESLEPKVELGFFKSLGVFMPEPYFFPKLSDVNDYSEMADGTNDTEEGMLPALKHIIFDSIYAHWEKGTVHCSTVFGGKEITVKQESDVLREFEEDCRCAKQYRMQHSSFSGATYYRIRSNALEFVTIEYGFPQVNNDLYMTMSQPPPPPPPAQYMNFVYKDGKAMALQLSDIFPSDSHLLQEFMTALQKRDDLNLDCSSTENMLAFIHRSGFSLSEKGVHLYYPTFNHWHNKPIEFLIPLENLSSHADSKWIVPILRTFE